MQKELQEARCEAGRTGARCAALEAELRQVGGLEEKWRRLQAEGERARRHLAAAQKEVAGLKDEKCDLYARYTAAIEERSALNARLHDLNLQVGAAATHTHTHWPRPLGIHFGGGKTRLLPPLRCTSCRPTCSRLRSRTRSGARRDPPLRPGWKRKCGVCAASWSRWKRWTR